MSKHTPGPWDLESNTRAGGTERVVTTSDGGVAIMWTPERGYGSQSEEEMDANARLISAAPELLAVAVRIVGAAISQPEDRERKLQEVAELARTAIAKARGK